jgi:hypothetical protein
VTPTPTAFVFLGTHGEIAAPSEGHFPHAARRLHCIFSADLQLHSLPYYSDVRWSALPTDWTGQFILEAREVSFNVVITATGLDALAAKLDPAYNSKLAQCGTYCITCAIKFDIKQI